MLETDLEPKTLGVWSQIQSLNLCSGSAALL